MKQDERKALLETPSKDKWERIGLEKRAGILVPLFSVYSADSAGIGDLGDLRLLIDWCELTGNSILQLLPMNEAGPTNCPYDAISAFALEPSYISLAAIPAAKKQSIKKEISGIRKRFPVGPGHVDYRIRAEKDRILRMLYNEDKGRPTGDFKKFISDNSYWIYDFAIFKALKRRFNGKPWWEWDTPYSQRTLSALDAFAKENAEELDFHMWVQWHLYTQFKQAKKYAVSKNILLKGDLPILISRDSADVWSHPGFFKLEYAAGAPPDMYCAKGQRWGVPTYNWENIASDGYRYLKEKLKLAGQFYDILRVDHVVGLFRIWTIPYDEPAENQGLNGFFDPKDEKEWGGHGKRLLSIILDSTGMLIAAEDLGIIPKVCPETLKALGIPGNDVQRWTKDWNVKHDFLDPDEYRFLSVSMLSTHDTTNWSAWWDNEAGTVDEALFVRKCTDRGIDYDRVKVLLFDPNRSRHGRLRWLDSIESEKLFIEILGKRREEILDFIGLYNDTWREKEKLWKKLKLAGPMKEESDPDIVKAVFKATLDSRSIFSINLITDILSLCNLLKGDLYDYRINTPGEVSEKNWSLRIQLSLEELLKNKISDELKKMIISSGRR